jgi:hypothetical protein
VEGKYMELMKKENAGEQEREQTKDMSQGEDSVKFLKPPPNEMVWPC